MVPGLVTVLFFPYEIKIIQIEYANSFIVLFSERETLILLFLYNFVNQPVNSSIVCFVAPEKICQLWKNNPDHVQCLGLQKYIYTRKPSLLYALWMSKIFMRD